MSLVLVLYDKSISFSCSVMKYNGFMHISQDCAQHFNRQFNTIYTFNLNFIKIDEEHEFGS